MLRSFVKFAAVAALLGAAPALAQVRTIDPDLAEAYQADPYGSGAEAAPATPATWPQETETGAEWAPVEPAAPAPAYPPAAEGSAYAPPAAAPAPGTTVPREDVFTAAEDLFGRGAEGLGGLIESILRDQGEPVAYISGQEASGAFVFGVCMQLVLGCGSGTMVNAGSGNLVGALEKILDVSERDPHRQSPGADLLQDVADRVGVLGPVQALERAATRVRGGRGSRQDL